MTASMNVETIASAVGDVDRTVQRDDAAEGGEAIGIAGAHVRVGRRTAGRGAARVGVLDDDGSGFVELQHDASRRIEIEQIGVRQFLALQDVAVAETVGSAEQARRYQAAGWWGFSP